MALKVVFMGTPEFAVPTLAEIAAAGHDVRAVYSRPPKPAGRGMAPKDSPVARFAQKSGLQLSMPASLKVAAEQEKLRALTPDVIVAVAYGLLLPRAVLDIPPLGCINLHASLLPRWRGAAPIARAIMAGDKESGIMVMRMEEGLDTGDIAMSERIHIGPDMTAGELHDVAAALGADLAHRALAALERGALHFTPQDENGATYAEKIRNDEAKIDWAKPAQQVHNQIRGLSPFPGAWFEHGGERIKVLRSTLTKGKGRPGSVLDNHLAIACADGAVQLLTLQRAGKQAMSAADFLRGYNLPAGAQLS